MGLRTWTAAVAVAAATVTAGGAAEAAPPSPPVGLSLWFEEGEVRYENGEPKDVTLYENFDRYVQELDITATIETPTDTGVSVLAEQGDMAGLDWRGIEQVDEDYRPDLANGGFVRSRFYRHARWMERFSSFLVVPVDSRDRIVGVPILDVAGFDNLWLPTDSNFIRRMDARQLTYGCEAVGQCTNPTRFVVQGLMQIRQAQYPNIVAQKIPKQAEYLKVIWTEDLDNPRYVPLQHKKYNETPYKYGFQIEAKAATPPNGQYFLPGQQVPVTLTYKDGAGNRLHPAGSLPTVQDFLDNDIPSGLRYYDGIRQQLTLYYALKHREGLAITTLTGPTNLEKMPKHVLSFNDFFAPQASYATVEEDGFTSLTILNPSIPQQLFPDLLDSPVSDTVTFTLPANAKPGTYVFAVKGRRDWGGEALNRGTSIDIQVGQAAKTTFTPTTGNCQNCHSNTNTQVSGLDKINHGLGDRRTCVGCHGKMDFEPDHALDYRIHLIHTRSERVPDDPNDCSMCHTSPPPAGVPPKGFPGIGPY